MNESTDGWFHQPPDLQTVSSWNKVAILEKQPKKSTKNPSMIGHNEMFLFATNPFYAWSSLTKKTNLWFLFAQVYSTKDAFSTYVALVF